MSPEEFLALGEELVERNTPACRRTAISRAYYSVFNAVGQLMRDSGLQITEGSAEHGKVWQDLLNCGITEVVKAGSQLGALHGMRIKADYKMQIQQPEEYKTAKFWVAEARRHLEAVNRQFSDSVSRGQAVEAIREYRRKIGR
jgi:hypothetical protein